jgi:Zn ribbon nucleic-acid-binding protein
MLLMATVGVKIGSVAARCPVCSTSEKFFARNERPGYVDVVSCTRCSTKFTYGFLMQQVTRQIIEKASENAIQAAKRKLRRRKK